MEIVKISKDIYEIKNFLSKDEVEDALSFFESLEEKQWFIGTSHDKESLWFGRQYHGERPELFKIIDSRVDSLFDKKKLNVHLSLQRYKKGDAINEHRDYWIYDAPHYIRYGICIYYNDDYEGGELAYPELDIVYKPKSGSLVIHVGNILHKSLPVKNEVIRYFSTTFIGGSNEYPVVLNQEIFADIHEEDGSTYGT
jgi:hypothetical protein